MTPAQCEAQVLARVSEKEWQRQVLDLARLGGWMAFHPYDSRRSAPGYPDLLLVHPGRQLVLWRELKTERGRLTPEQERWLVALTTCGQDAGVWRPSDLEEVQRALLPEACVLGRPVPPEKE